MESVVKTTTDTSEALSNYVQRIWKVSNYWREPPGEVDRPPSGSVKKVLIVLSDTGGGHKASSSAISAALQELRPQGIEIKVVDVLENYTLWFSNRLYNVRTPHLLGRNRKINSVGSGGSQCQKSGGRFITPPSRFWARFDFCFVSHPQ
jgi:hypothetical protein